MGNSPDKSYSEDDGEFSDEDALEGMRAEKQIHGFAGSLSIQSTSSETYRSNSQTHHGSFAERSSDMDKASTVKNKLDANLKFYQNKKRSKPEPAYLIKEILAWHGNYHMLQYHHYYIQWLFPTRSKSTVNLECQPLQEHEAQAIRNNEKLMDRAYKAFCMMLDFFGMQPMISQNGEFSVARSSNWIERYNHFYCMPRNAMIISRIISSMGEMGFGKYQRTWLLFLLDEIMQHKTLSFINETSISCWIDALESNNDQMEMHEFYMHLKTLNGSSAPTRKVCPITKDFPEGMNTAMCNQCFEDSPIGMGSAVYNEHSLITNETSGLGDVKASSDQRMDNEDDLPDTDLLGDVKASSDQRMDNEDDLPDTDLDSCFKIHHLTSVMENICVFMHRDCDSPEHCLNSMPNIQFYLNRMKCQPYPGVYLEELMKEKASVDLMKKMQYDIQWLFPTPEKSRINPDSFELTNTEAMIFLNTPELKERFLAVYELLLRCCGMELLSIDTGEIGKMDGWKEIFLRIDLLTGLPRVITRILTCLSVLGFAHFQIPLTYFLMYEAMIQRTLPNLDGPNVDFWIGVIEDDHERQRMTDELNMFKDWRQKQVTSEGNIPAICMDEEKPSMQASMVRKEGLATKFRKAISGMFSCASGRNGSTERNRDPYSRLTEKNWHGEDKVPSYPNLEFYSNVRKSARFWGHTFEEMLKWKGDYDQLEMNHQYIQWSMHNHLRITRIIESIGYLGQQKYQSSWVSFLLHEVFVEKVLPRLGGRQMLYWIDAIADESEKGQVYTSYLTLKDINQSGYITGSIQ